MDVLQHKRDSSRKKLHSSTLAVLDVHESALCAQCTLQCACGSLCTLKEVILKSVLTFCSVLKCAPTNLASAGGADRDLAVTQFPETALQ